MPTPNPITWEYYLGPPMAALAILLGCLVLAGVGPTRLRKLRDRRGVGLLFLALAAMQLLVTVPRLIRLSDIVEAAVDSVTLILAVICVVVLAIRARLRRHDT
jgi:hypothetical protein